MIIGLISLGGSINSQTATLPLQWHPAALPGRPVGDTYMQATWISRPVTVDSALILGLVCASPLRPRYLLTSSASISSWVQMNQSGRCCILIIPNKTNLPPFHSSTTRSQASPVSSSPPPPFSSYVESVPDPSRLLPHGLYLFPFSEAQGGDSRPSLLTTPYKIHLCLAAVAGGNLATKPTGSGYGSRRARNVDPRNPVVTLNPRLGPDSRAAPPAEPQTQDSLMRSPRGKVNKAKEQLRPSGTRLHFSGRVL